MRGRCRWMMLGLAALLGFVAAPPVGRAAQEAREAAGPGPLEPGDPAPGFALVGSDGKTYDLAEFKGKKAVVVAWFPKAFTGG